MLFTSEAPAKSSYNARIPRANSFSHSWVNSSPPLSFR